MINGESQRNRDQKLNLLFLQRHDQSHFDSNLLKINKKHYKGIKIYYTGYITIKKIDGFENIYSVNLLYLLVNHTKGYLEEKNGNKYLFLMILLMTAKHYQKNKQLFGMKLKTRSKQ